MSVHRALFAVVFTASYTANLAAFMITKEDYDKLTGIKDWRVSSHIAYSCNFKFNSNGENYIAANYYPFLMLAIRNTWISTFPKYKA